MRLHRRLYHEWVVVSVGGVALAIAMIWLVPPVAVWLLSAGATWPGLANPMRTIPVGIGDPTLQAWQIAWNGHALLRDPGTLWNTNAFYPERYTLAYSDSLVGYAPAGMIGSGPVAAVVRYDVVFVLAFALAFVGGYALSRQLGANRIAAAVAGSAFAYAPWRYAHDGHLNILSTGGIALALAMLARGHGWSLRHGYRPERSRPAWALGGWLVAAWQLTLGFGIGLPFAYVLAFGCIAAVVGWALFGRPAISRRLLLSDVTGGAFFVAVTAVMAYPYLQVKAQHPVETARPWSYLAWFSPPRRGFAVGPPDSLVWGTWHASAQNALDTAANEKAVLCGFALYALAAGGLFVSVWTLRQRLLLGSAVVASALLALGTNGPLYRFAYLYLPGIDASRTPGRLVVWTTLLLGVLAGGLLTALAQYIRVRIMSVVALSVLLVVLIEGLPRIAYPVVPAAPAALATARAPLMVLPTDWLTDENVELWSTDGFPDMVNGGSGLDPEDHTAIRDVMRLFPDASSVDMLRALGVRSVVVVRSRVMGTPFQSAPDAPTGNLGVTRHDVGPDVVYEIN